jgi:transcriptional regulator with XRE-family HTH domain
MAREPLPNSEELAARLRAARAYADVTRRQLAERIGRRDLDERALAKFEDPTLKAPGYEQIELIAQACGLPTTFFTIDLDKLDDPVAAVAAQLKSIADRLALLEARGFR